MAKEIIVLTQATNGTTVDYKIAFWYPITSGVATTTLGSVWSGASTAENNAILAGTVIEEVSSYSFPVGTPATAIKPVLQQVWTDRNAQINGIGPNVFFGVFFDSVSGWSA
jgi:hypothetical protein